MPSPPLQTVLEIVEEHLDDFENQPPISVAESLGQIHLDLHSLQSDLSRSAGDQNAERIFQYFAHIAAVAISTAAKHVLPSLQKGEA